MEETISGELSITVSPLESEHFGLVVARADAVEDEQIPALLSFCERNEVELVIARCDGRDLAAARGLIDAGMVRLEAQIAYEGKLWEIPNANEVREGTERDLEAVAEVARRAFCDMPSHYHVDPRLPLEACNEAYVDWTRRGLRGEAADAFFVAELDGRAVGFTMFGGEGDRVHSILSAVDPDYQRRGLYSSLFARGMEWGLERGAERMFIVTPHGNIAAQRNQIRLGLKPVGSTATFHGWRDRLKQDR
jgi:ribosomal protein S18 acetylase RimI-like enzyme